MPTTDITDEQIRELRDTLTRAYFDGQWQNWDAINLCRLALAGDASARSRVAFVIVNASTDAAIEALYARTKDPDECSTCGAIHTDVDCFGAPVR